MKPISKPWLFILAFLLISSLFALTGVCIEPSQSQNPATTVPEKPIRPSEAGTGHQNATPPQSPTPPKSQTGEQVGSSGSTHRNGGSSGWSRRDGKPWVYKTTQMTGPTIRDDGSPTFYHQGGAPKYTSQPNVPAGSLIDSAKIRYETIYDPKITDDEITLEATMPNGTTGNVQIIRSPNHTLVIQEYNAVNLNNWWIDNGTPSGALRETTLRQPPAPTGDRRSVSGTNKYEYSAAAIDYENYSRAINGRYQLLADVLDTTTRQAILREDPAVLEQRYNLPRGKILEIATRMENIDKEYLEELKDFQEKRPGKMWKTQYITGNPSIYLQERVIDEFVKSSLRENGKFTAGDGSGEFNWQASYIATAGNLQYYLFDITKNGPKGKITSQFYAWSEE